MIRTPNLERQQLEQLINTRPATDESSGGPILPYDPANAPDDGSDTVIMAPNFLDNSDFDYSSAGYDGTIGADAAFECFNFYRERFCKVIDVIAAAGSNAISSNSSPFSFRMTYPAQFVLLNGGAAGEAITGYLDRASESDANLFTDVGLGTPLNVGVDMDFGVMWFGDTLEATSAHALKAIGHSLLPEAYPWIPLWEKPNGWGQIGSSDLQDFGWSISTPLPINLIRAGVTYYFKVLVASSTSSDLDTPIRIFAGIWDATTSQNRFLESSNLDLSVTPVGTVGSKTYRYVIIADMDDGTEIMSDVVTITTGNSTLSTSNYNRLTWQNASGIINYRIYRNFGSAFHRVFTVRNGAHDFNDYGDFEEVVLALPTVNRQRTIAYEVSPEFKMIGTGVWQLITIKIEIPSTYDSTVTTGKQWLRFGIDSTQMTADLDVSFDRVMLSTSNGGWQRSARDLNKILTQAPDSQPTGDGGQGGGGIDGCFVLDTPITICNASGNNMQEIAIGAFDPKEMKGLYVFSGGNRVFRIEDAWDSVTEWLVDVRLRSGITWTCSPSERFITSKSDRRGTRIDDLTLGDEIATWAGTRTRRSEIASYRFRKERATVRTLKLKGGKTFCAGRLTGFRAVRERLMNAIRRALGLEQQFTKAIAHNRKVVGDPS